MSGEEVESSFVTTTEVDNSWLSRQALPTVHRIVY